MGLRPFVTGEPRRGVETWLQLDARSVGPELGCGPVTAQYVAPGAGRGAKTRLQFAVWFVGPGGRLRPGRCSVHGSKSELRPDHSLVHGSEMPGNGLATALKPDMWLTGLGNGLRPVRILVHSPRCFCGGAGAVAQRAEPGGFVRCRPRGSSTAHP